MYIDNGYTNRWNINRNTERKIYIARSKQVTINVNKHRQIIIAITYGTFNRMKHRK